jgi:hypothetical protein
MSLILNYKTEKKKKRKAIVGYLKAQHIHWNNEKSHTKPQNLIQCWNCISPEYKSQTSLLSMQEILTGSCVERDMEEKKTYFDF